MSAWPTAFRSSRGRTACTWTGHLPGSFGERHKVSGLPAMQFTATGIVPDVGRCLTMEAKMPGDIVYVLGRTHDELGGSEYYALLGYVGLNVPQLRCGEVLPLYSAIEKAVASGLIASCRGIYRGGLAVHAAMAAFGGRLGMTLDLASVPRESGMRDDGILYSESCGRFIVTVAPDLREDFEALFEGLPCAVVGEVTAGPRLFIRGVAGGVLMDESVFALRGILGAPPGDGFLSAAPRK